MTGIAGGMVLGPLFLTYNMLPAVMGGTNQFITLVTSLTVALQFFYLGDMNLYFATLFGATTIVSAYVGIKGVQTYINRTGKQSLITIILATCLILALVSLPINYLIKSMAAK